LDTDVSAARHPDSEPICEKPTVRLAAMALVATNGVSAASAATRDFLRVMRFRSLIVEPPSCFFEQDQAGGALSATMSNACIGSLYY
jgi:hypothetical protein